MHTYIHTYELACIHTCRHTHRHTCMHTSSPATTPPAKQGGVPEGKKPSETTILPMRACVSVRACVHAPAGAHLEVSDFLFFIFYLLFVYLLYFLGESFVQPAGGYLGRHTHTLFCLILRLSSVCFPTSPIFKRCVRKSARGSRSTVPLPGATEGGSRVHTQGPRAPTQRAYDGALARGRRRAEGSTAPWPGVAEGGFRAHSQRSYYGALARGRRGGLLRSSQDRTHLGAAPSPPICKAPVVG